MFKKQQKLNKTQLLFCEKVLLIRQIRQALAIWKKNRNCNLTEITSENHEAFISICGEKNTKRGENITEETEQNTSVN